MLGADIVVEVIDESAFTLTVLVDASTNKIKDVPNKIVRRKYFIKLARVSMVASLKQICCTKEYAKRFQWDVNAI